MTKSVVSYNASLYISQHRRLQHRMVGGLLIGKGFGRNRSWSKQGDIPTFIRRD